MASPYTSEWPPLFEAWAKGKIEQSRFRLQQEVALSLEEKQTLENDISFLRGAIERIGVKP